MIPLKIVIAGLMLTLVSSWSSLTCAQTYKWFDENGVVHFGDTVPPEYRAKATEIEVKKPKLIGGEDNARRIEREMEQFNREIQADQRERERQARQRAEERRAQERRRLEGDLGTNAVATPAITEAEKKQKVAECRDTFPTKAQTMQRVACFRGVHGLKD